MSNGWICVTCGVEYPPASTPPARCSICEDDRQYVGANGQEWTTLDLLRASHQNEIGSEEDGVWWIHTTPAFAIGQRAYLVRTGEGNLLWDCVTLIDADTIDWAQQQGGIRAMAVSHPHYYSTMLQWSQAFGNCPIWIHEDDRQ
jgi:hypothetical protein